MTGCLRKVLALACFSILLSSLSTFAQNSTAGQSDASAVFRAETHQVLVDVVVVDHSGQFVAGLKPGDFTILEDGKPQKIAAFGMHAASLIPPKHAPKITLPPHQYTNYAIADPQRPITIVLMDVLNTVVQDQAYAHKQMIEFLKALPPGQRIALFALGTHLQMIQGFTGDSDTLVAAAQKLLSKSSPLMTSESERQDAETLASNLQVNAGGPVGPSGGAMPTTAVLAPVVAGIQKALVSEENYQQTARMEITLAALESLARAVSAYPGRKNLLWLSAEFPIRFGPDFAPLQNVSDQGRVGIDNAGRAEDMRVQAPPIQQTAALLTASQIAVYPIDIRGTISTGTGIETGTQDTYGSMGRLGERRDTVSQRQITMEWDDHDAMSDIARETGGKAFYGSNDIKAALATSMNEGENYYTLAYDPENHKWNGKYRKIEVKCSQDGTKLTYRRGYYAVNQASLADNGKVANDQVALLFATAMQPEAPTSTMVLLKVQVLPPDATHKNVRIDYAISPRDVTFTDAPENKKHLALDLMAVAWDKDGKNQGESSDKIDATVPLSTYENAIHSYIPAHEEVEVKPGTYTLRLGVVDRASRRIGTVDVPLTVPVIEAQAK